LVTRLYPPIFGLQHCCRFRKRMQLNMGGLRLNSLFLYFLFHHLYLFFLFFFFNFPSFCSLYFIFLYSFFFYFLVLPMFILTGLSWCHQFQLHFVSLMPQIRGTFILIERLKMKPCPSQKKMTRVRGSNIDEGMTTSLEAPSRRITRSMSRGESSIPSPLSLFCITLV